MQEITSYTCTLSPAQVKTVRGHLEDRGFAFSAQPYAYFKASREKLTVVAYESGKLLVQGKQTREFVEFFLEPEVLREIRIGYDGALLDKDAGLERIGIDESGKGDYFGPLVIAGYYVPGPDAAKRLADLGVKDSKAIKSAANIKKIASALYKIPGAAADSVAIGPAAYNRLYAKFRNLNRLLAWGHARCIENLLGAKNCPRVIVDQFADKRLVLSALMEKGKKVELIQRHKAESDLAVAAASIVAREKFLLAMEKLGETFGMEIPRGASGIVKKAARRFVDAHGEDRLGEVAKLHFKTTEELFPHFSAARAASRGSDEEADRPEYGLLKEVDDRA